MDYSIVVISWKRKNQLKECLTAIAKQKTNYKGELIIIYNDTESNLNGMEKTLVPDLEICTIQNEKNLGTTQPFNQGIMIAQGKYVILMDNDVQLNYVDSIEEMIKFLESNLDVGAIGGEMGGEIMGHPLNIYACAFTNRALTDEKEIPLSTITKTTLLEADFISTSICMMRKSDLIALNGFKPFYFYYFGDYDLGFRLKNKLKKKAIVSPAFSVCHYAKFSSSKKDKKYSRYGTYLILQSTKISFTYFNYTWRQILSVLINDIKYSFKHILKLGEIRYMALLLPLLVINYIRVQRFKRFAAKQSSDKYLTGL